MTNEKGFTRRLFVQSACTVLATNQLFGTLLARRAQAAGHSGRMIGDFQLSVLSDGQLQLPISFLVGAERAQTVAPELESRGLPSVTATPDINIAVIQAGDDLIVIDGGAGPHFMSSAGELPAALDAAGVDREAVTKVICSHAHPDHLWGLYDDFEEAPLFPNAEHFIHNDELAFWTQEGLINQLPEAQKPFVAAAQRLLPLFDWTALGGAENEVRSGVHALHTPGHTPGHLSILLESGNDRLFLTSDAFSHPYLSFAHPDWASGTDEDADKGRETRLKTLDMLASEQLPSLVYHLPFPGLVQVTRGSGSMPFDYTAL